MPSNNKTQIIIAVLGLVGVIATAIVGNWDKLVHPDSPPSPPTVPSIKGNNNVQVNGSNNVINPVFNTINKKPSKKDIYKQSGLKADLRAIQQYRMFAPDTVSEPLPQYVCNASDTDFSTSAININDGYMQIVDRLDNSDDVRCKSGYHTTRKTILTCIAPLNELDSVINVSTNLSVYCLTGNCFQCKDRSKYKNKFKNWTNENREYNINYADIYVGNFEYVHNNEHMFNNFVRSISRVISSGSDEAFCNKNPNYCR